jgi:hypothetical protein
MFDQRPPQTALLGLGPAVPLAAVLVAAAGIFVAVCRAGGGGGGGGGYAPLPHADVAGQRAGGGASVPATRAWL